MPQGRSWQQVVALVDGVLCLVMAALCVVFGTAMVVLRDSEELARQTLGQLPDNPTMREIETSGIHAYLLGIGVFLLVLGLLKAAHGTFALRASKPGRPRSLGYVVFAVLFVIASLFLVVAHVVGIAGGQPVDAGLLTTGILSLAISAVVLVASLGVRNQESSMSSTVAEPGQTAKAIASQPKPAPAEPLPQLGKAGDGRQKPAPLTGRTGGIPKQNPSRTGGMPRQNPSQTGGMPRQNPSQTGGMRRQPPSQTGGMPKQNPSQTGGMSPQNPSQTGGMRSPSQTGGMKRQGDGGDEQGKQR